MITDFIKSNVSTITADSSPAEAPSLPPAQIAPGNRLLTAAEFHRLADVPSKVEWFANITNPSTPVPPGAAVGDFTRFAGIRARRSSAS